MPDQISEENVPDLAGYIARANDGDSLGPEDLVKVENGQYRSSRNSRGK
jgi:hypothetical protein